ncbi:hypothetical protein MUGA111182_09715 [Mucilaginibacter galii]|uniref:Uncharacterized protein n=1 Tax=Mucilaginibacter galii TaxID=2005073 RepID=A0A917N1S5_9SPHI|nr:hypothetical protein GCM10011425_24130 [Mucilaginibacter galii]
MFSVTVFTKKAETVQPIRGFKGIGVFYTKRQTLEIATGFKGVTAHLAAPGGSTSKIVHYRICEQQ